MSRIQSDLKTDLPRAIGSAWKVPIGPLRIFLQIVEERRLVAVAHAFENRQVQLERLLDGVEDPAHAIGRGIAGELLDVTLGQEVDVELRADALQGSGEAQRRGVAILRHAERVQHRPQHRRLEARAEREAFRHHDRGERGLTAAAQKASSNDPTKTGS